MKKNYISPKITVKTFSDTVHASAEIPITDTSAVVQAKQYLFELDHQKLREVLIMRK